MNIISRKPKTPEEALLRRSVSEARLSGIISLITSRIIAPAAKNGVVGVHPSIGLVSRDRVIPITDQTDTPGPITRTVTDAAILLSAFAGEDPEDPMTSAAAELAGTDFTSFLDADALDSVRVGVWTGVDEELLGDMSAE